MKYIPMGDQVLVEVDKAPDVSPGGIVLTEGSKAKPNSGVIVRVGTETQGLEVGDKVLFSKYVGVYINLDDKEYLQIHETDVLGYYEKGESK